MFIPTKALWAIFFASSMMVHSVHAQTRPTEIPDTCVPSDQKGCPFPYQCYATKPGSPVGKCDCGGAFYAWVRAPPTPDTPVGAPLVCERDQFPFVLALILAIALMSAWYIRAVERAITFWRLKQVKKLKFNTASRLLFTTFWSCFSLGTIIMTLVIHSLGWDSGGFWHDSVRGACFTVSAFIFPFQFSEISVAWLDLLERNSKLSKSSSTRIAVLRFGARFLVGLLTCFFGIMFILGQNVLVGSVSAVMNLVFMLTLVVLGRMLATILCPDRNDHSHANYHAAQAVRRVCFGIVLGFSGTPFVLLFGVSYAQPGWGNLAMFTSLSWMSLSMLSDNGIFGYVKFGSKKALAKFESEKGFCARQLDKLAEKIPALKRFTAGENPGDKNKSDLEGGSAT